ncbi:MAG TPA: DUF4097 family beta strand repeat-containing protein [Chloroflexota bacterium]|nr:DUF4097 family beta strand repeat-containing protein [Chloroflexota bacterium]
MGDKWDIDLSGIGEAVEAAMGSLGVMHEEDDVDHDTTADDVTTGVFDVGSPAALQVNTVSGEVRVRVHDEPVIRVHAEKNGSPRARRGTTIEHRTEGNTLILRTRGGGDHGTPGWVGNNLASVDYDITVPRRCSVRVKTVSAEVDVRGPEGALNLETVSGEVDAEDVRGDLAISTVSGDITVSRAAGELTLRTTSGDADVRDSSLHDFNLHTVSGDLTIETPLRRGAHYQAKTVSGDLDLIVPRDTGVTVVMKSMSGDVESELPAEVISKGKHKWTGRINGGGATIEMNSVSGDLSIRGGDRRGQPESWDVPGRHESDVSPRSETSPETESVPDEGTTNVLQMLQDGEIDVEEALRRLEER